MQLERRRPALEAAGVGLVAVGIGTPEKGRLVADHVGYDASRLLADPENALYDALSANPHVRRRVPAPWRVAAWAVLAAGMVLAVPAAAVERALGRAGTIVVVARAESAAD